MNAARAIAAARPARFNPLTQHRRAIEAKIHIARKTLAMDEDDYRQLLFEHGGNVSLKNCSEAGLEKVLARLKQLGFKPLPSTGRKPAAQHPMARKARALWISLYHLGVVRNASEEALEAFAKRQLGCEKLVWARQSDAYRLIEALKGMAERAGWRQRGINGDKLTPLALQSQLCELILARLKEIGVAPDAWTLEQAAFRLCGIEVVPDSSTRPFWPEHYARTAAALGQKLREAAPNAATADQGEQ